jgi:hypothetical protein
MTMPDPLAIVVDRTPHPWLLPNQKKHARTTKPYRDLLRDTAAIATGNALNGKAWAWDGEIMVRIEVYWEPGRSRCDADNLISACKGLVDGVFSKIDANDRQVTGYVVHQHRDNLNDGYCVLLIDPMETRA